MAVLSERQDNTRGFMVEPGELDKLLLVAAGFGDAREVSWPHPPTFGGGAFALALGWEAPGAP